MLSILNLVEEGILDFCLTLKSKGHLNSENSTCNSGIGSVTKVLGAQIVACRCSYVIYIYSLLYKCK